MLVKLHRRISEPHKLVSLIGEPRKLGGEYWILYENVRLESTDSPNDTLHRRVKHDDESMIVNYELVDSFEFFGEFNINREVYQ